jgi:hypothetical protein
MGAYVLVAGKYSRLSLVFEASEESHCDVVLEVDAGTSKERRLEKAAKETGNRHHFANRRSV